MDHRKKLPPLSPKTSTLDDYIMALTAAVAVRRTRGKGPYSQDENEKIARGKVASRDLKKYPNLIKAEFLDLYFLIHPVDKKNSENYRDIIDVIKLLMKLNPAFQSPVTLPKPPSSPQPGVDNLASPSGTLSSFSLFASPARSPESAVRIPAVNQDEAKVDEDRLLGLVTQAINDLKLILEPEDLKSEKQATERFKVFYNYIFDEASPSEINYCLAYVRDLKSGPGNLSETKILTELENLLLEKFQAPRPG